MSLTSDSDSSGKLCCNLCNFKKFTSKYEFKLHSLAHKSKPSLVLMKLSEYSLEKLKHHSYKINCGVAKRTRNYVSPLKISLKKEGSTKFQVITKKNNDPCNKDGDLRRFEGEIKGNSDRLETKTESSGSFDVYREGKEVENNSLIERFSASMSIVRKSSAPTVPHVKDLIENDNIKKEADKLSQEKVLERLAPERISVVKQNSSIPVSASSSDGTKLSRRLNVFPTADVGDVSHIKREIVQDSESDKPNFNPVIGKKATGQPGLTSITKTINRVDVDGRQATNGNAEKENKLQNNLAAEDAGFGISIQCKKFEENLKFDAGRKKIFTDNSLSHKDLTVGNEVSPDKTSTAKEYVKSVLSGIEENKINSSKSGMEVPKKHGSRIKNSQISKRNIDAVGKNFSSEADSTNKFATTWPSSVAPISPNGSVNVLRRVDEKTRTSVILQERCSLDIKGPHSDFASPVPNHSESQSGVGKDKDVGEEDECSVLVSSVWKNVSDESCKKVNYGDGFHSEAYAERNNDIEEGSNEVTVAFSSIPEKDKSIDQPRQEPLMAGETKQNNDGGLNQSFLHTFLNDSQSSQANNQTEGPEFMSLERLGQGLENQHGQTNYELYGSDQNTPMEQLSQQVQRLPNPPQISVISSRHMQAQQPPQLHAGLPPLSPQQSNSFDAVGPIQPPMPPPLYKGYVYNQNFPPQIPQQLPPRPPMLEQRPQIQPRPFHSVAASRPRARSYPVKRNAAKKSGPQPASSQPKQRRIETSASDIMGKLQRTSRNQVSNLSPTPKIPSGITVTPAKKNLEASKVANVLASRGITVTPSAGVARQSASSSRPQHSSNPVLNIGPGVSITTNNSRSGGGFAVPSPKRGSPLVNSDVERPERCATVDLTQDDDPPVSKSSYSNRSSAIRLSCNQCSKLFSTSAALENHKASHRTTSALPFKCSKCSAQYRNASGLQQHKAVFHKAKQTAPDLAIPIVDLNHPGARDQLAKCGVHSFLPLSQLKSNSLGFFGLPLISLDSAKEKMCDLNSLGASNILLLGKLKTLSQSQTR